MENEKNEKNEQIYVCIDCDFKCCYLSDWTRHTTTRKHKNGTNLEINGTKSTEKNEQKHNCNNCKKEYKTLAGLWSQ